jgi:ADP-ribose pyrophosphatase
MGLITKMRVEIASRQVVFKKFFFKVEEAHLRHEKFNGKMSDELVRLNLNRGDSVAAIVHDRDADTVILTEQFRYPTYDKGPGWLLEIPAGSVEEDEETNPIDTIRREILEEIGYRVEKVQPISTFYVSPGGTSERIHLYYITASPKDRVAKGGGVLGEGEDIRTLVMPVKTALQKIETGEIVDAKSIVGLQWLQIQRLASVKAET